MSVMPIEVFISHARDDEHLRDELVKHLSVLRDEGRVHEWFDRKIIAGADREQELQAHLESADLIVLLISSSFFASEYCQNEAKRALERRACADALVLAVVVRPCDWRSAYLAELQVLPRDGRPVVDWPSHDHAWEDVVFELRNAISNSSYLNRENRETSSVQFPIVPRKETRESQRFVHGSAEAEGFLSLKKLGNPYPRLSAPDAFDDSEAVPKIYIFPALPHVMFLRRGLRERYLAITALCMPRPNLAIQSLVSNLGSDLRILRECRASDIRKADKERIFVATARALPDTFIVTATLHRLTSVHRSYNSDERKWMSIFEQELK